MPSRLHPGKFYALPQAPQQYKQLLMMSGFDRYFQIAPCFRDEDARADRSPGEFYQLDLEMAFATQEDVFAAVEPVMQGLFTEFTDWDVTPLPFPRIPYREAMREFGTDKPDLRNPIVIADVSERSGAGVRGVRQSRPTARAVVGGAGARRRPPRSFFDQMVGYAQSLGAPGLGYILRYGEGRPKGRSPSSSIPSGPRDPRFRAPAPARGPRAGSRRAVLRAAAKRACSRAMRCSSSPACPRPWRSSQRSPGRASPRSSG